MTSGVRGFLHNYLGLGPQHAQLQFVVATTFGLAEAYQAGLNAKNQVVERLWAGNQVKGSGERSAFIKVGEPQLGSGKLPLYVGVLLQRQTRQVRLSYKWEGWTYLQCFRTQIMN